MQQGKDNSTKVEVKSNLRLLLWVIAFVTALSAVFLLFVSWVFLFILLLISIISILTAEFTYMELSDIALIFQYLGLKRRIIPLENIEKIGKINFYDCVLRKRALRVYNFDLHLTDKKRININTNWLKPYEVINLLDLITDRNLPSQIKN